MNIATTILQQLGGSKFIAMTGAKNLGNGGNYLQMTLPKNQSKAKYLTITLNELDTYEMEFSNMDKEFNKIVVAKHTNVYADTLRKVFASVTKFETSL